MSVVAQEELFGAASFVVPKTEGIKYAGSKRKLLPQILSMIAQTGAKTVLDGFSGSTRVSQALAHAGYDVISSDKAVWSEAFARCYLQARNGEQYYKDLIAHLNACTPVDGWFSENYGGDPDVSTHQASLKKPWQLKNARKLDAIRNEIDYLDLSDIDKSVALTSLMLALDKVDSTLGHYCSYLKDWSPRSFNPLLLQVPNIVRSDTRHIVSRGDIFDTIKEFDADIAYFDPPYGSNNEKMPPSRIRYSAYYHVWTTICLNDRPALFGKAARREDTRDSADPSIFEEFRRNDQGRFIALDAIDRLIRETPAEYILLSYSSGGRATAADLHEVMSRSGEVISVQEVDHKENVMANMVWTRDWLRDAQVPNREFLFLVRK